MKENIIKISVIIVIITIIIYNLFIKNKMNNNDNLVQDFIISNTTNSTNSMNVLDNTLVNNNPSSQEEEKIKIYITGEVINPGVYELAVDSRIEDAISIAGGITPNANLHDVNLAFILEDAMKIYIPNTAEEVDAASIISTGSSDMSKSISNESTSKSSKININKASSSELEKIPGVGPSIAQKIITYREENGKFSSIDDLKNVSGIGSKKFESIKDYITV